jgi:hypothetical protein
VVVSQHVGPEADEQTEDDNPDDGQYPAKNEEGSETQANGADHRIIGLNAKLKEELARKGEPDSCKQGQSVQEFHGQYYLAREWTQLHCSAAGPIRTVTCRTKKSLKLQHLLPTADAYICITPLAIASLTSSAVLLIPSFSLIWVW